MLGPAAGSAGDQGPSPSPGAGSLWPVKRLLVPALVVVAGACGGGADATPVDPVSLLAQSRAAMAAVQTASFEMASEAGFTPK